MAIWSTVTDRAKQSWESWPSGILLVFKLLPKGIATTTKAHSFCTALVSFVIWMCACMCTCLPGLCDLSWIPAISRKPERHGDEQDLLGCWALTAASAALLTAPLALGIFSPHTLVLAFPSLPSPELLPSFSTESLYHCKLILSSQQKENQILYPYDGFPVRKTNHTHE